MTTTTTTATKAPIFADTETVIDPVNLTVSTTWPTGGRHVISLVQDMDLGVNVRAGKMDDGTPRRYDADGMVLVVFGVDEDLDEVHVRPAHGDMIETLQQTLEVCQRSLDALRKIQACRI